MTMLLELSDQQFDPAAKERTKAIIGLSDADARKPLQVLLDLCVRYSWCSNFEIVFLNLLADQLKITEEEKKLWRSELVANGY